MTIPAKMTLSLCLLVLSGCNSEKRNSHKNVPEGNQKASASQKSDGSEDLSNEKGTRENIIAAFEAYLLDIINKQDGWLGENEKKRFNVFRQGEIDVMEKEFEKFKTEVIRICTEWDGTVSNGININISLVSLGIEIKEIPEIELYGVEMLVKDIKEVSESILAEFHRLFLEHLKKYQEADFLEWQSDLRGWTEFESDAFIRDLQHGRDGNTPTSAEATWILEGILLKNWNTLLSSLGLYGDVKDLWSTTYEGNFRNSVHSLVARIRKYCMDRRAGYEKAIGEARRKHATHASSWSQGFGFNRPKYQYDFRPQSSDPQHDSQSSSDSQWSEQTPSRDHCDDPQSGTNRPFRKKRWGETVSASFRDRIMDEGKRGQKWRQKIEAETGVAFGDSSFCLAQKYYIWRKFVDEATEALIAVKVKNAQKPGMSRPKEAFEWKSELQYDVARYVAKTTKAFLGYLDVDWSQSQRECQANQVVRDVFLNKLAAIDNNPKLQRRAEGAAIWEPAGLLQNHTIVRSLIRSKEDPDGSDLKRREPWADYTYRFIIEYFNAN